MKKQTVKIFFPRAKYDRSAACQFSRVGWLAREKYGEGILETMLEPAYQGAWCSAAEREAEHAELAAKLRESYGRKALGKGSVAR